MKSNTHPENYRQVAFKDMSNNDMFITKSTVETKETTKIDGVEYPLFKLEISRTSHPFYTGKSKLVDTAGRVDKFRNKYANFSFTFRDVLAVGSILISSKPSSNSHDTSANDNVINKIFSFFILDYSFKLIERPRDSPIGIPIPSTP